MKKPLLLICLTFLIFLPFRLSADHWDCMSKEEANRLVNYLKANPYVVDYCDPCDVLKDRYDGERLPAYLIRVSDPRVVPCEWDEDRVSVQVDFVTLCWGYTNKNYEIVAPKRPQSLEEGEGPSPIYRDDPRYCLTLNYHWTLVDGKPSRLFFPVEYGDSMDNDGLAAFPAYQAVDDPQEQEGYRAWLEK